MNDFDPNFLSSIEDVIEDAKKGKMFILVDDEDRENCTRVEDSEPS